MYISTHTQVLLSDKSSVEVRAYLRDVADCLDQSIEDINEIGVCFLCFLEILSISRSVNNLRDVVDYWLD